MLKITQVIVISILFLLVDSLAADELKRSSIEKTPVTVENVYERPNLWPFNVSITNGNQPSGKFPGILLRIEEDGTALIDYGRDGKHRVHVKNTDLIENANKILEKELVKESPNFVRQTNNMFVTRQIGNKQMKPLDSGKIGEYNKLLIVYCDEGIFTEENWVSYKSLLNDFNCVIPLIIPTKINFYKGLAEHSEWDNIHMILPYLSVVHSEHFDHDPILETGGLTFVLIDLEGKVYECWKSNLPETHKEVLEKVVRILKRDYENCLLLEP